MVFSEYHALCRQNQKDRAALNDLDKNSVDRARVWLQQVSMNAYEVERVLRDLILMAAEADRRGETLRSTLGDEDTFYRNLADSIDRGNLLDYLTGYFGTILFGVGVVYGGLMALFGIKQPADAGRLMVSLVLYTTLGTLGMLLKRQFKPPLDKNHLPAKILLIVLSVVFLGLAITLPFWMLRLPLESFPMQPTTVCLLLAAVGLLLMLLRVVRYNLMATRHPWREQFHS